MSNERKNRVFLSYASEDLPKVQEVYKGLIKRGLDVWFDKEDLKRGRWKKQIRKAIARSRNFVICISEAALKKTGDDTPGFQDEELDYAYSIAENQPDNEFAIIPVMLEDCSRGDHRLTLFQQYDLFEDFDKVLDKLSVDMGGKSLSDAKAKDERSEDEKLVDSLYARATAKFYAGAYEESIRLLDSVLVLNPDNFDAWITKGIYLRPLGRSEEAVEAYDKALKINPNVDRAWYLKGIVLHRLGRNEEAIVAFNKALQIDPKHALAWVNKGFALAKLGRKKEAFETYENALTALEIDLNIRHEWGFGWYNKGALLDRLGRNEEAIEAYDKALQVQPNKGNAWFDKGIAFDKLGRKEEAFEAYENALTALETDIYIVAPYTAIVWYNKGAALDKLGMIEAAVKAFEIALHFNPNYARAWIGKGIALLSSDRKKTALDAFKKALELDPKFKPALEFKVKLMKKLKGKD